MSVLIVDDDFRVRTYLRFVLDEAGLDVQEAATDQEALRRVNEDPQGIDLVLLAVEMPDVERLEMLAELRGRNPDLRCCILTRTYPADQVRAAGALAVFPKPITEPGKLLREVRLLARPSRPALWGR